jgi:hypothetical protein
MIIPVSESLYAKKFSSLLVLTAKFSRHACVAIKLERQQVRVSVKRKATDISTRPAKIIRQNLQETDESHLQPSDLKSISQSLYRQRLKEYPALPKDRMATHACLENLAVVSCFTFYRYSYLLSFKFSVVSGMVVFILAFQYSFALCVCSYSALATVFCASPGNFRIL